MKSGSSQLIVIISIIAMFFAIIMIKKMIRSTHATYTIGILQTASHPALDAVKNGFITQAKALFGDAVAFIEKNAQGNIIQAQAIAQQFHNDPTITAIFSIATPAAQAAASVEHEKPLFISAVTDPASIGLDTKENITGTTDRINIAQEIESMVQLLPHVQRVAILYNPAEANSLAAQKEMAQELRNHAITVVDVGIHNEAEIAASIQRALRSADALIAPTDNMVALAIDLIASQTRAAKKPLIVSDNLLVSRGALMAQGVDYYACGSMAADIAYQVLINKQNPSQVPMTSPSSTPIFVNKKVAQELAVTIPASFEKDITWV